MLLRCESLEPHPSKGWSNPNPSLCALECALSHVSFERQLRTCRRIGSEQLRAMALNRLRDSLPPQLHGRKHYPQG